MSAKWIQTHTKLSNITYLLLVSIFTTKWRQELDRQENFGYYWENQKLEHWDFVAFQK